MTKDDKKLISKLLKNKKFSDEEIKKRLTDNFPIGTKFELKVGAEKFILEILLWERNDFIARVQSPTGFGVLTFPISTLIQRGVVSE